MISEGILLVNKPKTKTSFYLVNCLRKITHVRKIGHAGTLDPLATGVMILLIGQKYTRLSNDFILHDKEYHTRIELGKTTDSYDADGTITATSPLIPTLEQITSALTSFQGKIYQTPPMFSAKKIKGKKCYDLARQGIVVERIPKEIHITTELLSYSYPYLDLKVSCTSGTYVRSIAHDLGTLLGCGGHIIELTRTRSGPYHLSECTSLETLTPTTYQQYLKSL